MFRKVPFLRRVFLILTALALTILTSLHSVASVGAFFENIAQIEPPPNDNFANAQPILGASGIIHGTNVGATKEDGEREHHPGKPGGASVWYRWQAPFNGRFTFTTFDPPDLPGHTEQLDTLLAVYTGSALPVIPPIVSDDNDVLIDSHPVGTFKVPACGDSRFSSRISFAAVGGTFYHIAVDRGSTTTGRIILRWGRSEIISGRVTEAGGRSNIGAEEIRLIGDTCQGSSATSDPSLSFHYIDVPTGGNYVVLVRNPSKSGDNFERWGTSQSISPLSGSVTDFNFYQSSPTGNIEGTVTMPIGSESGVTVTCTSHPMPIVSKPADPLGGGRYQCASLPQGSEYKITPTKLGFDFLPSNIIVFILSPNQNSFGNNFTGTVAPFRVTLDELGQVAALDSVLLIRDPFPVININNLLNTGVDRNTRVTIFLSNFQLGPTETPSSIVINLVGSNNQSYDIPAEDVRTSSDPVFTQVTFRLPDTLTAGTCTFTVKARGLTSNMGAMRIR